MDSTNFHVNICYNINVNYGYNEVILRFFWDLLKACFTVVYYKFVINSTHT